MIVLAFLAPFALLLLITCVIQKRRSRSPDFYGRGNRVDSEKTKYDLLAKDYTRRK
ncbi:MAG: hypothetical protein M3126_04030 [Candidatus Eremiobacteraeota bacterium]|nr:hypothetical protein [Candidatus Eremiobacteraeota bacterium]